MENNTLASLIANRRNVKPETYNDKTIAPEVLQQILESANWAPTHGYTEPWRFVVYSGASLETLGNFLANLDQPDPTAEGFNQMRYDRLKDRPGLASHVLGVVMRRGDNPNIPEVEEVCSVAMAVQNMWLTAHSLGVSAYWSTGAKGYSDDLRDFFGLDDQHHAMGLFYLGYSDAEHPTGRRLSSIEQKVIFK
jgi:nitroreductase